MNKITKKLIRNTTKDTLVDLADQLKIDLNKKTKKAIDRLATRFSILMKNEITKQTKKKLKSAKLYVKSNRVKNIIPTK